MYHERLQRRIAAQKAKTEALIGQFSIENAAAAKARRLLLGTLLEARLVDQGEAERSRAFRDLDTRAPKRDRLKLEQHPLRTSSLPKMADETEATKPAGR